MTVPNGINFGHFENAHFLLVINCGKNYNDIFSNKVHACISHRSVSALSRSVFLYQVLLSTNANFTQYVVRIAIVSKFLHKQSQFHFNDHFFHYLILHKFFSSVSVSIFHSQFATLLICWGQEYWV